MTERSTNVLPQIPAEAPNLSLSPPPPLRGSVALIGSKPEKKGMHLPWYCAMIAYHVLFVVL